MSSDRQRIAGSMVFAGSGLFLLGMMIAEAACPGYSPSRNYISDLGVGSTALLFTSINILYGSAILSGVFILRKEFTSRAFLIFLGLSGVGTMGVGLFPETVPYLHIPFAITAFVSGGISAVISCKFISAPFSFFGPALGIISLLALLLLASGHHLGLGPGGIERLIVYPLVIWSLGLGGTLMGPIKGT